MSGSPASVECSHRSHKGVVLAAALLLHEDKEDVEDAESQDDSTADHVEPSMCGLEDVREGWGEVGQEAVGRTGQDGVVGEEGQVATGVGEQVGVVEEAVSGEEATDGDQEEAEGVEAVELVEESPTVALGSVRDVFPGDEAGREKNGREGCYEVLAPLGVDDAHGREEVDDNHETEEDEDVEVEVGGEEGEDEPAADNVEDVEDKATGSLTKITYVK